MKPDLVKTTTNFSRGLNMQSSHLIQPEECQIAENFLFDDIVPYVRKGIQVYGSLPAPVVSLKKLYKKTGSSYFVAFAGNNIYADATSGTFVSVSSANISSIPDTNVYADYIYYTDFSSAPKFFNGSSVDLVGLSGPIHRKQIADFETNESWIDNVQGSGVVSSWVETNYLKITNGLQAKGMFVQSGTAYISLSKNMNLNKFGSNVNSIDLDIIQTDITHEDKSSISGLSIRFQDTSNKTNSIHIHNLSSWIFCSSNNITITHSLNKTHFIDTSGYIGTSTDFSWARIKQIDIVLTPVSNQTAQITIDNIKMIKSPPKLASVSTASISGSYYYGSSKSYDINNYYWINDPVFGLGSATKAEIIKDLQTEGYKIVNPPIPSGVVYYKCTFTKAGPYGLEIESNPSYQTSGITITATSNWYKNIKLWSIPKGAPECNIAGRKIYRRMSYESAFRYVTTLTNNEDSDWRDGVPSTLLGKVLEEDHWPPPQAKYIFTASNQKTYYLNLNEDGDFYPSRLRCSRAYEPHYCPLENTIDISPYDGTEATGIFEYMNLIHILKEHSTWYLDENTGQPRNAHNVIGCIAPWSIAIGENEVFWLSEEGIIKYNLRFNNVSRYRLSKLFNRLPSKYIGNAKGVYYNGFYLLAVTDQGSIYNNLVICYDVRNDAFSTFPNLNVNCWNTWQGGKDGYRLFFGNNSGQVCEFFAGNYDISTSISSRIRSKDFGTISPGQTFRKTYTHIENLDDKVRTINLVPYYDFANTAVDNDSTVLSGTYNLCKFDLPQKDEASFCSIEIRSSGRYKISQVDLYSKEEELR